MARTYTYPEFYHQTFSSFTSDASEIKAFVDGCPEGDILEIGGGSGRTIGFFTSKRHLLVESDPEMLDFLEAKAKSYPNVAVIDGKCPNIPIDSNSLAGVFAAFGTIGEINPICVALQEMARVVVPGGKILLSAANPAKYKSPPAGIYRSKSFGVKDFSFVSNTLPANSFGPGEFQTHIWLRQPGSNQHFTVLQYFPNLEQWLIMIEQAGLNLITDKSALEESQVFSMLMEKPTVSTLAEQKVVETVYDSIGENYDKFISKAEYGLPNWISPHLDRIRGLHPRVLDLACANGYVGRMFSENNIKCSELIGYDISRNMIGECQKSGYYTNTCRFDLALGLPGVGGLTTDIVTAFGLMEFVSDPSIILQDIKRVLVLGGELLCSFEATETGIDEDQVEIRFKNQSLFRYRRSEETVIKMLRAAGFDQVSVERKQGYRSPTTGQSVEYLFVHATKQRI